MSELRSDKLGLETRSLLADILSITWFGGIDEHNMTMMHSSVNALYSGASVNYNREGAAGISEFLWVGPGLVHLMNGSRGHMTEMIHSLTNGVTLYHRSTTGGVNMPRSAAMHKSSARRRLQTRKTLLFTKWNIKHLKCCFVNVS